MSVYREIDAEHPLHRRTDVFSLLRGKNCPELIFDLDRHAFGARQKGADPYQRSQFPPVETRRVEACEVAHLPLAETGVPTERPVGEQSRGAVVGHGCDDHYLFPERRRNGPKDVHPGDGEDTARQFSKVVQEVAWAPVAAGRRQPCAVQPVEVAHGDFRLAAAREDSREGRGNNAR